MQYAHEQESPQQPNNDEDIRSRLNLNALSTEQYKSLHEFDTGLIGTPAYLGVAGYWWSGWYKHTMRGTTPQQRAKIHNMIIALGFELVDTNEVIAAIIKSVTGEDQAGDCTSFHPSAND